MNIVPMIDRAAERLARIRGDQAPVVPVESAPMPEEIVEPVKATARQGGLGPKQLEWLRANVGSFGICEHQAIEAENHRKQLLEAVRA